ncbi:MAG: hypothetical protein EXS31_09700 [Pedosphaera sp.]|nr:hypothetical protein [Pedosphaera sp.]
MNEKLVTDQVAMSPQQIASSILGRIEWYNQTAGYCRCPGEHLHTHPTGDCDCMVHLDLTPTIYCFHASCKDLVAETNATLRKALRSGSPGTAAPVRITKEERALWAERDRLRALARRAAVSRSSILAQHAHDPTDLLSLSPTLIPASAGEQFQLLVRLFQPSDVVWIGRKYDSCDSDATERRKIQCRKHFRIAAEWLQSPAAPEQFTCPSVFKPGVHSRSNKNVVGNPFLVVESDSLSKPEICGVFRWCQQFMRLRAVVDTAGKSLHGWFDSPSPLDQAELRAMLPVLGCDPSMFKKSQPCRLAGAMRDGRLQRLLYLDLEAHR